MTRKLKSTCLALAAIFAMSASGAQASGAHFRINGGAASDYIITGTADTREPLLTFTVDGGQVECNIITAKAIVETGTTSSITFGEVGYFSDFFTEPGEEGPCEAFGLQAKVNFNGCHYTFHAGERNVISNDSTGTVDIPCTPGKGPISITTPACEVTVPVQESLWPVTYTNISGSPDHITVDADIEHIHYSESGSLCKSLSDKNGVYEGKFTLRAYESESGLEGSEVSLTVVDGGT